MLCFKLNMDDDTSGAVPKVNDFRNCKQHKGLHVVNIQTPYPLLRRQCISDSL